VQLSGHGDGSSRIKGPPRETLVHRLEVSRIRMLSINATDRCSAPMTFFASTDIGNITNRFSQDMELIDMELPLALINTALSKLYLHIVMFLF
jgi:hypothetical protein